MQNIDEDYMDLIEDVMTNGEDLVTRNAECRRLICLPLSIKSTPLISIRKTAWKNALFEFEWMLSGSDDINDLNPKVHHWWEPWANEIGIIKYNYGHQFRHFSSSVNEVDQIEYLIDSLKNHPYSRRACITTWNTADMAATDCKITNCHSSYVQCFLDSKKRLTMKMYQRSVDIICGLPHNLIQYWAFLLWLAHRTGTIPYEFKWEGGDSHVYTKHFDIVSEMQYHTLNGYNVKTPQLVYNPTSEKFLASDFSLDSEYTPIVTTKAVMLI